MGYTPNNATVYLAAFEGCIAGLGFPGGITPALDAAAMADAYAQELDTLWGVLTPTVLELKSIEDLSITAWGPSGRSPLAEPAALVPAAYHAIAAAVIALAKAGNAQVVGEGIDPNAGGGGGGSTATQYAFVLRPGGTAGANVYIDWPTFYAAASVVKGPILLEVDSSISAANVPSGTYNFPDGFTIVAHDFLSNLTFENGAVITTEALTLDSITLTTNSSSPVFSPGVLAYMNTYAAFIQGGAGAAPFFDFTATNGESQIVLDNQTTLGDGTTAVLTVAVGQTCFLTVCNGATIAGNALTGSGIVHASVSSDGIILGPQAVGALVTIWLSPQYQFVFQPGGSRGGNVYTSWAELETAMGSIPGPKYLEIDGSFSSPTVPAGTWIHTFQDVTIVSKAGETLTFAAGAIISSTVTLFSIDKAVNLQNTGTVVWTISGTALFYMNDEAGFEGSVGGAFINIPAGQTLAMIATAGAGFGDTANVAVSGSGTFALTSTSNIIVANALGAGLTFNYANDATSELQQPQGSAVATFTYVAPPNVLQEIDSTGSGAGVTNSQNSTGTLKRLYSGRVRLDMQASFNQAGGAPGVVTMQVTRDGTPIVGSPSITQSIPSGSTAAMRVTWTDTLPDNASHHYGWTASTSAGTIAVTGGQASLNATEEK